MTYAHSSTHSTKDNKLYMHTTVPMHAIQFTASPEVECSDSSTHSIPVLYQIWGFPTASHNILDDCSSSMAAKHGSQSLSGVLFVVLGALIAQLLRVPQQCLQLHPARQVRHYPLAKEPTQEHRNSVAPCQICWHCVGKR